MLGDVRCRAVELIRPVGLCVVFEAVSKGIEAGRKDCNGTVAVKLTKTRIVVLGVERVEISGAVNTTTVL